MKKTTNILYKANKNHTKKSLRCQLQVNNIKLWALWRVVVSEHKIFKYRADIQIALIVLCYAVGVNICCSSFIAGRIFGIQY